MCVGTKEWTFTIKRRVYEICPLSYWPEAEQCRVHGHICSGKLDDIKPKTCPLEEKKSGKVKKVKEK